MLRLSIILILIAGMTQCSTLLTKKDYAVSVSDLKQWDIQKTIKHFPEGEKNKLITEMEKAYLNLLCGKPGIDGLIAYAKKADNQIRVKVSRELKSFFYMETPEGYYASEHEIIWLHLLLSWGYSMRGERDKAFIEAKICAFLLSSEWSDEGRFDDPFMRVLLAAMWAMCGEWEKAQIDFRAAHKLDKSMQWAKAFGDMEQAPDKLVIILGGPGPEPEWHPDVKSNPVRGSRGIRFRPQGIKSSLVLKDKNNYNINLYITPDSSHWYKRHFIRDNEIQDLIQDTKYAEKVAGSTMKNTGHFALNVAGGLLIAAGGITLGAGVMLIGLYIESGELALLGLVPMIGGPVWGYNYIRKSYNNRRSDFKEEADPSDNYRFVRFLPEYAWVGCAFKKHEDPFTAYKNGKPVITSETFSFAPNVNNVYIGFFPDTANTAISLKPRLTMGRAGHPDSTDEKGDTELFNAINSNDIDYAKRIIKTGADINQLNYMGISPLHAALNQKNFEMAKLLLDNGANADIVDSSNDTPLNIAVANERVEFTGLLISNGADVNYMRRSGWAPLHSAVYWNNMEIALMLLKKGARVNEPSAGQYREFPDGTTPMQIAVANKNKAIIDLLKKYGAKEVKEKN
ncbi:MAG: ankyrin repeat domain-containing protein [Spirochaetota bacterium]